MRRYSVTIQASKAIGDSLIILEWKTTDYHWDKPEGCATNHGVN